MDRILTKVHTAYILLRRCRDTGDSRLLSVAVTSNEFGVQSERSAAIHLQECGYRILHRNYRIAQGEIDLVADHHGTLVFVEVKARRSKKFGPPAYAVNVQKQKRLTHVARHYLHRYQCGDRRCRFDVLLLTKQPSGNVHIEVIQNAFELGVDD